MKHRTRFDERQEATQHQETTPAPLEFASPEEMLRHDAARTPVPPEVGARLGASTAALAPPKPWWKRILGR